IRNGRPGTIRGTVRGRRPHSAAFPPSLREHAPNHREARRAVIRHRRSTGRAEPEPKRRLLQQHRKESNEKIKNNNTKLPLLSRTQKTAAAMTAARHKQKQADDTRPLPVRLRLRPCDLPFGRSQQTTQTQPHVANKNGGQSALVKVLCWRLAGRIPWYPKKEAPLSRLLRCRLRRSLADDEVGTSGHRRRNNSIRRTTCV
ncbi:hypothetical protein IscW_ISCW011620, partial [Ixodes scapularis]